MLVKKVPFYTLIFLISFATVNAMIVTPALPTIALDFHLSSGTIQSVMTSFLFGYTFGQLIYGPLAAGFGRKKTLFMGITLQILASILCFIASMEKSYELLLTARAVVALGAGVGLKMTFTLIHDCYHGVEASRKTSHLLSVFAIAPAVAVMIGGWLSTYLNYQWCFVFCIFYGAVLFLLIWKLPETSTSQDVHALKFQKILHDYTQAFKNKSLVLGGILMGLTTSMLYIFSGMAPLIAEHLFNLNSNLYGFYNLFTSSGILWGSLLSAYLAAALPPYKIMWKGFYLLMTGIILFWITYSLKSPVFMSLFIPMFFVQFGLPLLFSNASLLALNSTENHAHGSACMSFLNLGTATIACLCSQGLNIQLITLPVYFLFLLFCILAGLFFFVKTTNHIRKEY